MLVWVSKGQNGKRSHGQPHAFGKTGPVLHGRLHKHETSACGNQQDFPCFQATGSPNSGNIHSDAAMQPRPHFTPADRQSHPETAILRRSPKTTVSPIGEESPVEPQMPAWRKVIPHPKTRFLDLIRKPHSWPSADEVREGERNHVSQRCHFDHTASLIPVNTKHVIVRNLA
jgi:hypothetical protein